MHPYHHIFNSKIPEQILIWANVRNEWVDLGKWQYDYAFWSFISLSLRIQQGKGLQHLFS